MKTLIKVVKVGDGVVHYDEICRKSGKVMISDTIGIEQFKQALASKDFGFTLDKMNKQQAIKTAAMFGAVISEWDYDRTLAMFHASVDTKQPYDNGHGYMVHGVYVKGSSPANLFKQAILLHDYNGQ